MSTPGSITLDTPPPDAAIAGGFSGDAPPDAGHARFFGMLLTADAGIPEPDGTGADEAVNPTTAGGGATGSGSAAPTTLAATSSPLEGTNTDAHVSSDVGDTTVRLGKVTLAGAPPVPQPVLPASGGGAEGTAVKGAVLPALDLTPPDTPITAPSTAPFASSDMGGITVRLGTVTLSGAGAPPVTADQLRAIMPHAGDLADRYVEPLNQAMAVHGINTPPQRAAFLAQVSVESGQLREVVENLNYTTARRITQVWPVRFPTEAAAAPYTRNPEALANRVYAIRNGNGDEKSGDGYRFRGRGLMQVTGRDNYRNVGFVDNPEALAEPQAAANTAAAFWANHGLNGRATGVLERAQFESVSRVVNRHDPNPQERWDAYQRALRALGIN